MTPAENRYRPRSPLEVESDLDRITSMLEQAVGEYEGIITAAAEAEADWRACEARAIVALADSGRKMTVPERDARAYVMSLDEHRAYLLMEATAKGRREFMAALRSQIAALQTLAANRRQVG